MPQNLAYLLTLCLTTFTIGIVVQSTGSMIPFLAAQAHTKATSYYFVFICRSIGAVIGAFLYKILERKGMVMNHVKVLGITSFMYFVTLIIFQFWHTSMGVGVLFGIYFGIYFVQNIPFNILVLLVPSKDALPIWLSLTFGSFGFGCLVSPLLVNALTVHSLTVASVLALVQSISYLFVLKDSRDT